MTTDPVGVDHRDLPRRYTTVHGYRRAYVRCGDGPPVLLLHGIGDSADTWRSVLGQLAERHTVIAPDLLGHGQIPHLALDVVAGLGRRRP